MPGMIEKFCVINTYKWLFFILIEVSLVLITLYITEKMKDLSLH